MSISKTAVRDPAITKESIMRTAREAIRFSSKEGLSEALRVVLNDLGYYQIDINQSGLQYLQDVVNNSFTDGLPGILSPTNIVIESLSLEDYYLWETNMYIVRAVRDAIEFSRNVVIS